MKTAPALRPTLSWLVLSTIGMTAPFIGSQTAGMTGYLWGLLVALVALGPCGYWMCVRLVRPFMCAICERHVIHLDGGTHLASRSSTGTTFRREALILGHERRGFECQTCGRVYCGTCVPTIPVCRCSGTTFQPVRLRLETVNPIHFMEWLFGPPGRK
jgi:hypothetical protein